MPHGVIQLFKLPLPHIITSRIYFEGCLCKKGSYWETGGTQKKYASADWNPIIDCQLPSGALAATSLNIYIPPPLIHEQSFNIKWSPTALRSARAVSGPPSNLPVRFSRQWQRTDYLALNSRRRLADGLRSTLAMTITQIVSLWEASRVFFSPLQ